MTRSLLAGIVHALILFGAGFALGVLRVLLLAPHVGETPVVLAELPIMLALSVVSARWTVARFDAPPALAPRLAMSAAAFALLMAGDLWVSTALMGNTLGRHLARYGEVIPLVGLVAQLAACAMPALLLLRRRRGPPHSLNGM